MIGVNTITKLVEERSGATIPYWTLGKHLILFLRLFIIELVFKKMIKMYSE